MDPQVGLWIGQSIAFVLFLTSEILGISSCQYNSIFDAVWAMMKQMFPSVVVTVPKVVPASERPVAI